MPKRANAQIAVIGEEDVAPCWRGNSNAGSNWMSAAFCLSRNRWRSRARAPRVGRLRRLSA
jgi:hypothetical protein